MEDVTCLHDAWDEIAWWLDRVDEPRDLIRLGSACSQLREICCERVAKHRRRVIFSRDLGTCGLRLTEPGKYRVLEDIYFESPPGQQGGAAFTIDVAGTTDIDFCNRDCRMVSPESGGWCFLRVSGAGTNANVYNVRSLVLVHTQENPSTIEGADATAATGGTRSRRHRHPPNSLPRHPPARPSHGRRSNSRNCQR